MVRSEKRRGEGREGVRVRGDARLRHGRRGGGGAEDAGAGRVRRVGTGKSSVDINVASWSNLHRDCTRRKQVVPIAVDSYGGGVAT